MKTVRDIGEFGLIRRITRILPKSPAVVMGIGDDCAVVRVGENLVLMSCDLSVEGVHFSRDTMTPNDIGWKAAASSISDIAAMGGAPMFSLVSMACPTDTDITFLESLYAGISAAMSRFGAAVVGGDTTKSTAGITIDVTVIGRTLGNRYLNRKGVLAGDVLAVTGEPGLSSAGLHALQTGAKAGELIKRHCRPRPRIKEGQWLCGKPCVHAMIDVSDGLAQDVGHLSSASRFGVSMDPGRLPVTSELAKYCEEHGLDPIPFILNGGEDYELAFAISGREADATLAAFVAECRTPVTVIGEFTDAWNGVRVGGQEYSPAGFDHFRDENHGS